MALSREYHRVSEMNRIMRDHLDFLFDVEIEEEPIEPAALPKRIIRDRMNPLELRPLSSDRQVAGAGNTITIPPLPNLERSAILPVEFTLGQIYMDQTKT